VLAGGTSGIPLKDTLRRQMSAPTFPVDWNDVPAAREYRELRDGITTSLGDGGVTVRAASANHPDAVFAYRLEHDGASVVYATDTEHYACVDPRLVTLAQGADVLVYDAQYLPEEYAGKVGWGHSTYEAGVALARAAGVRKLVLFHHDPSRDDAGVARIEERARELFDDVVAAREGLTIDLGEPASVAA